MGESIGAVVSFNTPYAEVQHERVDFEHPRGGKAKYLEANLKEMLPRYSDELAEAWKEGIEAPAESAVERFENGKRRVKMKLLQIALDLMGRAQRDAPIEEGVLRASAAVEMIEEGESQDVALERAYAAARAAVLEEFDIDLNDIGIGSSEETDTIWRPGM